MQARHNLLYRPFLLERESQYYWEDCTLDSLIAEIPSVPEVQNAYRQFVKGMEAWSAGEQTASNLGPASIFQVSLMRRYEDARGKLATTPLVLRYTLMLNPGDEQLVIELERYRNQLLSGLISFQ